MKIKVDEDFIVEISKGNNSLSFQIEKYYRKENKFLIHKSYLFGKMTPEQFKELFEAAYEYLKKYQEQSKEK